MMREGISTVMIQQPRKWVFLLVFWAVLGIPAVFAQVERATVMVEGMACPFCAFGIEKRLKKVPGVGSIDIDIATGTATLTAAEGGSIAFSRIPEAIQRAGFTAGTIHLTAVGTVAAENDERLLFTVGATDQGMHLVNLPQEIQPRISEFASSGVKVRLRGSLRSHADELPGLEPDEVEALQP